MEEATPRQEELLDHALLLVREVGLSGLTVRRLAARVGFSEAALYRHYPSKKALLVALVERLREERLLGPIRAIAGRQQEPAARRLAAILRHHVATILELDGLPFLLLAEATLAGEDELLAPFRATMDELLEILTRLVEEHRSSAPAPEEEIPAPFIASLLVALPAVTAILHRVRPDAAFEAEAAGPLAAGYVGRLLAPEGDSP